MITYFEQEVDRLYERMHQMNRITELVESDKRAFFELVDRVSLSLMEDENQFYGYFLFQMSREIRFDMMHPTGIHFKGAKYVIYFNPSLFLRLTMEQMEGVIIHEIHHILSLHLLRAKELKGRYSTLAVNMAMDLIVNKYIEHLPPQAITLDKVNRKYQLRLPPFECFEYYVDKLQIALDLLEDDKEGEEDDSRENENEAETYNVEKVHDLWEESDEIDEKTLQAFTEKCIGQAKKGKVPECVTSMIGSLGKSKEEVPWHIYLSRLMGRLTSSQKKTTTRINRRQPNRLDLRGSLRSHKPEVAVALDISGSISEEEFKQAMQEVLHIVKHYNHQLTLIECDDQIRRTYRVKTEKDLQQRLSIQGATKFTPVIEYANKKRMDLLIYFTDGKGENRLQTIPKGYKILWVLSGRGDSLSVERPYGEVKKLSRVEVRERILDMDDVRSDGYSMQNQQPLL